MKRVRLLLALGGLLPLLQPCNGQNQPPRLKNVQVSADTVARQVVVTYSLADKEEPQLKVSLKASGDGGATYLLNTESASGDVGYPVPAGPQKKIVWSYAGSTFHLPDLRIKLDADTLFKIDIASLVGQVDSNRIPKSLSAMYGQRSHLTPAGVAHLAKVRTCLDKPLAESGLEVSRQPFKFAKYDASNLYVRKAGLADKAKTFVVCSYYNSSPAESYGADASASGMAGVLEALRILSKYNFANQIPDMEISDGGVTRKGDLLYDKIEDSNYTFVSTVVKGVVAALADMGELQHSTVVGTLSPKQ